MGRAGFCLSNFRRQVVGVGVKVPSINGRKLSYINFDNAASTPALLPVTRGLQHHLKWYSGVHRGTGYKSLVSTYQYNRSREIVAGFVKADLDHDVVIFLKNTTEAINKLSYRIELKPGDQVLVSGMEHHSNDLPWRNRIRVNYAGLDEKGRLDLADVEAKLKKGYPRTRLVGICGASNVTGHINDIHYIAALAHEYRARILVDGAQLVPHHPIDIKPASDPGHIDYLAFSGHKIYAPYGCGVLLGPRESFEKGVPEYSGGGTIRAVQRDAVYWGDPPEKEEAGSPNVIGALGLADTLSLLQDIGLAQMADYEASLTDYALNRLREIRGVSVYGDGPRVAVISFNITGIPHSLVGAVLCYEAGIGVRTGCFCAQPYVRYLLGEGEKYYDCFKNGSNCLEPMPGMVRISLAAYNTRPEIDHLVEWLKRISGNRQEFIRRYRYDARNDEYLPREADVSRLSARLGKSF